MNNQLLLYVLQSGLCLGAFYVLYLLALRHETCFGYNRFYLLLASAASFMIPLLDFSMPAAADVAFAPAVARLEPYIIYAGAGMAQADAGGKLGWGDAVTAMYFAGLLFFAMRFGLRLFRIYAFIRYNRAEAATAYGQHVQVITTAGALPAFSFLHYIFLDSSQPLDSSEKEQVLQHEAAHVQQGHTYDILYLELLSILFWFNPLLRLYRNALTSTHEFLADAQVLRQADKQAYSHLLARQVCQKMDISLGNYFNKSLTLKRINMIHSSKSPTPKAKQLLVLPLLAFLAILFSSSTLPLPNPQHEGALQAAADVQKPEFPGGDKAMMEFISKTIKYPRVAINANTVGYAVVQATIDTEGNLGDYKIIASATNVIDQEVISTLRKMPKWTPGQQGGTSVATAYLFAANFIIDTTEGKKTVDHKPDLEEVLQKASAALPHPVYLAGEVVVVAYGK